MDKSEANYLDLMGYDEKVEAENARKIHAASELMHELAATPNAEILFFEDILR